MGFNNLDSLALSMSTSPALGGLSLVGTGLAVYGVYKLVKYIFDESRPKKVLTDYASFNSHVIDRDEHDDYVEVFETPEEPTDKEEKVKEVVKTVGWIFGGMLIRDAVSVVRGWGYRRVCGMFTRAATDITVLFDTVNKSMTDASRIGKFCTAEGQAGISHTVNLITDDLVRNGFYTYRRIR